MFNIRKHAFSEKWRNIISAVIYIIFIIYSVNLIIQTEQFKAVLCRACAYSDQCCRTVRISASALPSGN